MSGFVVQGPKSDYRDSSGLKNRLFPFFYVVCILVAELVPASVRTTLSLYTDYARACFNSSSSKSQLQTDKGVAERYSLEA